MLPLVREAEVRKKMRNLLACESHGLCCQSEALVAAVAPLTSQNPEAQSLLTLPLSVEERTVTSGWYSFIHNHRTTMKGVTEFRLSILQLFCYCCSLSFNYDWKVLLLWMSAESCHFSRIPRQELVLGLFWASRGPKARASCPAQGSLLGDLQQGLLS